MKKSIWLLAIVAAIAMFALSACATKNNANVSPSSPPPSSPPAGTSPAAGGGAVKEVTVNASNWKFEPNEITANVGDTLKLTLNNTQGAHGLEIPDFGVNLKNGDTKEIKLDKAGSFEFHCSIQCGQGHDSMTGALIVQ
ncbi:cupredoxin domain-containing protein [Cohnella terricola]|uniref:Cytochrome C oxidase subunit II n=1 Tax=Cohnella terricola TaxID=1289167 RepID=A0A559JEI4_9BACL|nr:cupredoxin domain-containing protein [Cohnella terricola]TVX98278.1 cytochrome C oxidase subunit II [Cohnella terricola]